MSKPLSELDKWSNVFDDVKIINEFLDFLNEQKIRLCEHSKEYPSFFLPTLQQRDNIIAKHFDIDLNQLEQERRKLLEKCRSNKE